MDGVVVVVWYFVVLVVCCWVEVCMVVDELVGGCVEVW